MELKFAILELYQSLFERPGNHFCLSHYLKDDFEKLRNADAQTGQVLTEELIKRELKTRRPLDDGGFFSVQNNIHCLRLFESLFGYAESHDDEVDPEFIAEANQIIFGNHCLMDYGGHLYDLTTKIVSKIEPSRLSED